MSKSSFAALAAAVAAMFAASCERGATSPDALAPLFDATRAPTRTSFEGHIFFCPGGHPPERVWETPGGTFHFRNVGNTNNQWVMGNPLIDGIETNEVDVNIDFKHGVGYAHGTGTLVPDAVNGTWQIKFHVNTNTSTSHGGGHGTGDLKGMSLKWKTVATDLPSSPPCEASGAVWTTGIITTPRGP